MSMLINILRIGKRLFNVVLGREVYYRKQVKCNIEQHGSEYGGWVICPDAINTDSIVYSFGIGEDITFDLSLINKYGLRVYGFDPTPRSIQWVKSQQLPAEFILHEYGIADYDGIAEFQRPKNRSHISHRIMNKAQGATNTVAMRVKRISTILNEIGHSKIDIMKMDIEGAEYSVLEDIFKNGINIEQLLVEFHHSFDHLSPDHTRKAIELLNKNNFKIFHISPSGREYSFIKINY